MANKNPVMKFKKGDGRAAACGRKSSRALPPDLKEARVIRTIEFEQIIYKYMDHSPEQIQKILDEHNVIGSDGKKISRLPSKELIVLKLVHMAMETGDLSRLNFLMDRTIGKVVDNLKIDATVGIQKLHDIIIDELEKDDKS